MLYELERFGRTAASRTDLTWRYVANLWPTVSYRLHAEAPTAPARSVLQNLDRDGIAITTADALLGAGAAEQLFAAADEVRRERASEVAAARAELERSAGGKAFLVQLLGYHPALDPRSPFAAFALHPTVLQIVNGYYRMFVRLRHYNVWHNLRTSKPATQSQWWHRDPEDLYILKLFVALDDVDEGCGPFTYAVGTHHKGRVRKTPRYTHKDGSTKRSSDDQMSAVVPPERWVKGIGPRGTMIFADTHGYHKGGLARERDRLLYVAEYTSLAGGRGGISTFRRRSVEPPTESRRSSIDRVPASQPAHR